ncbi:hypothetical protein [Helicovermis profundi]|uniref:Uncharacterized protein n=1 Tax=Helicovermis profundi TaxID=3065157 RepID=A0AAU9E3M5_9FIRM|nr:hypothetical protein HLPR_14720 [Clostridia bacterium S502]
MFKKIEEDALLGIGKFLSANEKVKDDLILSDDFVEDELVEEDDEITSVFEQEIDETLVNDNKNKIETSKNIESDFILSLKEQIEYLKSQIDVKDKQLDKKDELIRNFQVLMNNDKDRILLLENKMFDKSEENNLNKEILNTKLNKTEKDQLNIEKSVNKFSFFNIFKNR